MGYPEGFVEDVRRAADIVRVISEHVSLRRAGNSWKGLCPFHKEKTPSFNVRSEPPLFHCFGCSEGGDVFKFVMLHERLSFPEALESLARRFGVPMPETREDAGPGRKKRETLFSVLEAAAEFYARALWTPRGKRALDYLRGRGFEEATLKRIRAGAAPDAWDGLLGALQGRYPVEMLNDAGLVMPRRDGNGHYDRFRNRVVFPILNEAGRVVGFGARCLDGSEPKYLNSPETPVYQKSRVLYGLNWAKEATRSEGRLVLMEGYLDVARALERGVGGGVATCGTALTPAHGRLLRRFTERVYVNFDQDAAGVNAARRSLEALLDEGLKVHVVTLPEGHDPDSYLREQGAEAYATRLSEAPVAMEWLIRRSAGEHDVRSPEGKAAYLDALLPWLRRVGSAVERAAWLPLVVDQGALDEHAAEQEIRRALARGQADGEALMPRRRAAGQPLLPAEKWLLALLVQGTEGVGEALGALDDKVLSCLRAASVLRAARALHEEGLPLALPALESRLGSDDEAARLLREVAVADPPVEAATPEACVQALQRHGLEQQLTEIQKRLEAASGEAQTALLEQKLSLRREMASL